MKPIDSQIMVIFGASGDLARRKLIPSLFDLYAQDQLPPCFAVVGSGRSAYSDESFRERAISGIKEFAQKKDDVSKIDAFAELLYYQQVDVKSHEAYVALKQRLEELDEKCGTSGNYVYYLSTPPSMYEVIPKMMAECGLNKQDEGWRRLIVEKPFGYDLKSAKELNAKLLEDYEEEQIYRIDHYLGKETVQNMLVTRFSNGIFEPLWNRNYISHVEVTSSENIGVGDRGGYYDSSGAMRDMLQNHLLQLVGMVAMEPPTVIEAHAIRNETLKVFQSIRPVDLDNINDYVIRGQYTHSTIKGEPTKGYLEDIDGYLKKNNLTGSRTETFVALKFYIDNWRWGGVPFYIRTGKRLPTKVTEVVIHFKETPHKLFSQGNYETQDNQLVIRIQPDEGVLLKFGMKIPGAGFEVKTVNMDFHYSELAGQYVPSAYERLLLDAMIGDATLYARGDAVEAAWEFVDPIMEAWKEHPEIPLHGYPAGTWGPDVADSLVEGDQHTWRYPCRNLADDGIYCEL